MLIMGDFLPQFPGHKETLNPTFLSWHRQEVQRKTDNKNPQNKWNFEDWSIDNLTTPSVVGSNRCYGSSTAAYGELFSAIISVIPEVSSHFFTFLGGEFEDGRCSAWRRLWSPLRQICGFWYWTIKWKLTWLKQRCNLIFKQCYFVFVFCSFFISLLLCCRFLKPFFNTLVRGAPDEK